MTDIEKPDVIGATRRAETIRQGMISFAAAMEAIGEAYENRDWVALGHKDWDTYCEKEFSEKRLKLTREQREQAVLAFRGAGMSTRAIGSALGVGDATVRRDLAGASNDAPGEIQGTDGKTYAATKPATPSTPAPVGGIPQPDDAEDATEDHTNEENAAVVPADSSAPSDVLGVASDGAPAERESADSAPADPEEAGAGVTPPPPALDLDDDEQRMRDWRRGVSRDLMQALVDVHMRLQPSPAAWLEQVYLPGSYPDRNMPRVRDCFSPEAIRTSAQYLFEVAEWLEMNGAEL